MPGRRMVDPLIWNQARELLQVPDGEASVVAWLYLMSGPHSNMTGLYRMPPAYLAEDLRWSLEKAERTLAALNSGGQILFDPQPQMVWVPAVLRAQPLQNERQVRGAIAAIDNLPDTPLMAALYDALGPELSSRPYIKPLAEQLIRRLGQQSPRALASQDLDLTIPDLTGPSDGQSPKLSAEEAAANRHRLNAMAAQAAAHKDLNRAIRTDVRVQKS